MQHSLDLLATLTLLGAAQGILLSLSLLGLKQGNRLATRLLAALMATISISLTGSVLLSTKYILIHPYLTQVTSPFAFLGGPLLYLYVKASTARRIELRRKHLWHFVPFGLCVAYYLPLYLQTKEEKLNYLTAAFQNYPPTEWRVRSVLLLIQAFIYFILAVLIFVKHSREVNDQDSSAHKINLLWLRTFLVMIFVICGIGGFRVFFNFREETILLIPVCFTFLVYVAGYMALKHPEALTGVAEPEPSPVKKYEKSTLTPERAERYLQKLLHVMETEKPYRDGDLTVQKLAERLSIPVNHLSQIINERLEQNFFDFVNAYRVKEAQRLLLDPTKKHYSVIAIAEEVGFNSKSTFNAVFKKHVNLTPSEFRKASNGNNAVN